jgi:tRNA U38,U39,U40 pseudouridine synthase TruA
MATSSSSHKASIPANCHGCGEPFASRNAVFRHLRETNGQCLSPSDYQDFLHYVNTTSNLQKTIILYGYIPTSTCKISNDSRAPLLNGNDAAGFLLEAIGCKDERINRSFGSNIRATDVVAQDDNTGAVTEVLVVRIPQLTTSLDEWIETVQDKLSYMTSGEMQVFGRLEMPQKRFSAEQDVSHVRVEYLLPADFIFTGSSEQERLEFFKSLPDFHAGRARENHVKPSPVSLENLIQLKQLRRLFTTKIVDLDTSDPSAVLEKEFHVQRRKRHRKKQQDKRIDKQQHDGSITNDEQQNEKKAPSHADNNDESFHHNESKQNDDKMSHAKKTGSTKVLQRRRFHNFTPRVMAHEFLSFRRLDRFYHRVTLRIDEKRPFVALSLTGDMFLQGQAVRIIGVWLALARGLIDPEIVDCLFDEEYPPLVPTPPVPLVGLYAVEASYMAWEGKSKLILTPRHTDRYPSGWNNERTISAVKDWHSHMHQIVAKAWMEKGVDENGRLVAEREWTEQVLEPWAETAKEHLKDYRAWKALQAADSVSRPTAILPPLDSVEATVPVLFEKVLYYLRKADASGLWPSTTPKRQLVMIASSTNGKSNTNMSLSAAHMRAKSNKADRPSAYEFSEGQGQASGSFSVGAFPGDEHTQPKANTLFPELMKYAFELEMVLCPDREPSSTIAINRNAQFRPHTDSGAGAGQSTSLIVGLGTYVGGELVVEGEKKNIRYKALEFNGWTERHWTMPFQGERYSLVWFTPKGCEGVKGIDLCR